MELSLRFFEELAILLLLAAGTSFLFNRLRIPPVIGYLLVGILVGPGSLGLITTVDLVRVLGDLGVILLMFGLGLDFEINRVRKTATFSVVAGVASVISAFVLVNAFGLLAGLHPLEALFVAAGFSICGTAVNLKILADMGHLKTKYGSGIMATIVVTDIAAVLLLTALSGIALGGGLDAQSLAFSLLKAASFLILAPAFGFLVVPRILNIVARETRSREALLLTTLSLCFVMALISQRLGFSLALGAFVMGMVISEARVYHPIEEMVKPLEHIFATLFFLSVGLSVQIGTALPYWQVILAFSALIALSKVVSVSTVAYLSGQNGKIALAAGWGLVPIGEFAFVIINEGVRFGTVSSDYLAVAVAVALVTAALSVVGLRTLNTTVNRMTDWLPAGVLNLFTLLQLRTAGSSVVPGLSEATAHLKSHSTTEIITGVPRPTSRQRAAIEQEEERKKYQRAAWGEVVDIGLNSVLVITIILVLIGLGHMLAPLAPGWLNIRLAAALTALILCAPSLVFIFKSGADLATLLSGRLAGRFQWVDPGVTRGALLAASTFLLFVFLQVAILPIVLVELRDFSLPVLVVAGSVTIALGIFAWRRLVRFQAGLAGLVRTSLATAGRTSAETPVRGKRSSPLHGREKQAPYRAMIEHLRVSPRSPVAGKSIGASQLRERSGVSVLGIDRRGDWIGNPDANEVIQPGDELVIIGSEEQRELAEQFLGSFTSSGEPDTSRARG